MNLVGPGPIEVHFDDAAQALKGLEPGGLWVDLGSGAGFPGLVLAELHPNLDLELVDSRAKRCWFLEHVVSQAPPRPGRLTVRCQRVEDLPQGVYDGVISRAFAPPPAVVEHARRLLRPGGELVLMLQAEARIAVPRDFVAVGEVAYRVGGRPRRSERWRYAP